MNMEHNQILGMNEELNLKAVEFLTHCIKLMNDNYNIVELILNKKIDINGVVGANDLFKRIEEYHKKEDSEKVILEGMLITDITTKLEDITFVADLTLRQIDKYKRNVGDSLKAINAEKNKLDSLKKFIEENVKDGCLSEELNEELCKRLEKLEIKPVFVNAVNEDENSIQENVIIEEEKEILDLKHLLDIINERIVKCIEEWNNIHKFMDNKIEESLNKDVSEKFFLELHEALREDVSKPRNEFVHKPRREQEEHETWERAKLLKAHFYKWKFLYENHRQLDKLDKFMNNVQVIIDKFGKTSSKVIVLGGIECSNISELIQAMIKHWDLGIELLKANHSIPELIINESEVLLPTYNILYGIVESVIKCEQEKRISEITEAKKRRNNIEKFDLSVYNDYKQWYDACMFKFIYGIKQDEERLCWKGNSWNKDEFIRNNIYPLLNYNNSSDVRKAINRKEIDVLAEYGLLSYYCQQNNNNKLYDEDKFDIEKINMVELSILKHDRGEIPLYELYYNLLLLVGEFRLEYKYCVQGIVNNRYISQKKEMYDILVNSIQSEKIDFICQFIEKNSFANFRAWLLYVDYANKENIDNYFSWYLKAKKFKKGFFNIDDKIENYIEYIDDLHKKNIPTNELEYQCLLCYEFFKMLIQSEEELNDIELHICNYYKNSLKDNNSYRVKQNELKKVIPYNGFRNIGMDNLLSNDDSFYNNIEERLIVRNIIEEYSDEEVNGEVLEGGSKIKNRCLEFELINHILNGIVVDYKDTMYATKYYCLFMNEYDGKVMNKFYKKVIKYLNDYLEYVNRKITNFENSPNILHYIDVFKVREIRRDVEDIMEGIKVIETLKDNAKVVNIYDKLLVLKSKIENQYKACAVRLSLFLVIVIIIIIKIIIK